jgi:hypothetical protein
MFWVCDNAKIFLTSKFSSYLLFSNVTLKKPTIETTNGCKGANSKPPGPIIMIESNHGAAVTSYLLHSSETGS